MSSEINRIAIVICKMLLQIMIIQKGPFCFSCIVFTQDSPGTVSVFDIPISPDATVTFGRQYHKGP